MVVVKKITSKTKTKTTSKTKKRVDIGDEIDIYISVKVVNDSNNVGLTHKNNRDKLSKLSKEYMEKYANKTNSIFKMKYEDFCDKKGILYR